MICIKNTFSLLTGFALPHLHNRVKKPTHGLHNKHCKKIKMRLEINGILRTILKDKGESDVIKITIYDIPFA